MVNNEIDWGRIPNEFVVFDLETTGLEASECNILEIGALRFIKENYLASGKVDTFQAFVKQDGPIPTEIVNITSITDEMASAGDELDVALKDFLDFVGNRQVIAYNAKFDKSFIKEASKRTKIKLPVSFKPNCALELAREKIFNVPNYKLKTLAELFELDTSGAHRALNDCVMTFQIYIKCLNAKQNLVYKERDQKRSSPLTKLFKLFN